ncbi:hypothetical protein NEOLI_004392 [Neolecta irregularis DAH-3]|uniref:C2H2-type domain-containing protein n=1 Tax=Neolecta irregularis (strain DAH-3) TaxID=1198029 RepID=A0A1U7LL96_NEOID|nr:hypothetical protein NEOLI_004392 [Neolecta irregularis DAH-3]|eukprot:OLL23427.1 hypothetical protein NEOLI_004392 [Neolecta irregularis DAH-3]
MVIDLTGDEDGATETQRKQGESPLTRENEIPRSSQRQQKQTRKQGEMEPSLTPANDPRSSQRQRQQTIKQGETQRKHEEMESSLTPENDPRSSQRQQKQTIKQGETQRKHEEMESSLTPENDPRSSQRQQKQTIKQGETQRKHEEMGSPLTPENEIPRSSQRQQNYKIYGCEFRRCRAELHSFETLMHHIFKVHGTETYPSQSPEPEKWYCMWIDCASVFESRGAWIQHISLEHLQTLRQASTVPCRVDGCATPLTPENQDLHYLTVHPDFARDEWNAPDAIGSELYQTPLISVQSGDSPDPFQSTRKKRSRKSFTPGRVLCVAGWSSDYEDILAPLLGPKRSVSSDDPKPKSTSSESSPVLAGPGPWMTINQDL